MLNVFNAILDFCQMLASFVQNLVTGLFSMINMIPQAFTAINYTIGYMPPALLVFALSGITICIVFHIIGR